MTREEIAAAREKASQRGDYYCDDRLCDMLAASLDALESAMDECEQLKRGLAVANQATNCAKCGKYKHTPNRMDGEFGGYVCGGCMETRIHELRGECERLKADNERVHREMTANRAELVSAVELLQERAAYCECADEGTADPEHDIGQRLRAFLSKEWGNIPTDSRSALAQRLARACELLREVVETYQSAYASQRIAAHARCLTFLAGEVNRAK